MNSINIKGLLVIVAAVALVAWLLWPYLPSSRYSTAPLDAVRAPTDPGNQVTREPYDPFDLRPGSRSGDYDQGRDLAGRGR
jgi:hypothetical protein